MNKSWKEWAPLPLRLMTGFGFIFHGAPKIFSGQERKMFTGMLEGIGVPMPEIMAWVVGLVELFGGIALIVGAFVSVAAILLIINMLVALFTVHLEHGFNFMNMTGMKDGQPQFGMPGYEINLLYIAALLALLIGGAGAASLDHQRSRKQAASQE